MSDLAKPPAAVEDAQSTRRRTKGTSKQCKAGIFFSISRLDKKLRAAKIAKRVGSSASVFVTAALEHVVLHALQSASDNVFGNKKRVSVQHVVAAIRSDPDLARLFAGFVVTSTSEVPRAIEHILPISEKNERRARKSASLAGKKEDDSSDLGEVQD